MKLLLLAIAATLTALPAGAQVVKCTDANGKVSYTDKPCPAGKPVDIVPNAVGEVDQSKARAERQAVDKRIAQHQAEVQADLDRRTAAQQAAYDRCQGYLDAIKRQQAWLNSISAAVRASAAAEIEIQRRNYRNALCDRMM